MSNKRIDLSGEFIFDFVDEDSSVRDCSLQPNDYSNCDSLAICEFDNMLRLPKFVTKCVAVGIKPICGVRFILKTPEDCFVDNLRILCYAEDEEGTTELETLYNRSIFDCLKYEDLCRFSKNIQVGLDITDNESNMLSIENIIKTVFIPDFILINENQHHFECWEKCQRFLELKSILICGGDFFRGLSDDDEIVITKDYAAFGYKAYEYVIENPRKIADRISGNYKFNVSLIEKIIARKEWNSRR